MKLALLLFLFSCIELQTLYAQIIPIYRRDSELDINNGEESPLDKDIEIMENIIKCAGLDTTFAGLTDVMAGITDDQWRRVRKKIKINNSDIIVEDSLMAVNFFNQCLLEKYFLLNYRKFEKKIVKSSNSISFGLDPNYREEHLFLENNIDEKKFLNCTWKQIWDEINNDDLVVEFTTIDGIEYAVLLDKSHPYPYTVRIDIPENINYFTDIDNANDDDSAIGFWGDCLNFMVGKKRVFFSPSIELNYVAIEYLRLNGNTLFEIFDMYRVSSSREICKKRNNSSYHELYLYGDIEYSAGVEVKKRGDNLGQLHYTKNEIDSIKTIFKGKANIHSFEGMKATEQCFRNMSDSNVTMLHIASHGQYNATLKASELEAMKGSILAFCGYNIYGADPLNDGKVTAEDISSMNLIGCELVVLSACQTGLGAKGVDGVYGLQRGFKSAGVDAIMMSIRDVHDEATAQLMTIFYRELATGRSKREALKKAMEEIRGIDKYKKAEYWASFIMLDGLD